MDFINYNKGLSDTNDGLIHYQDLMGLHEFTDNPVNNPVEPFEDFRGRGAARRANKRQTKQASKLQRINARQAGKVAKKQASPIGAALKKAQDNKAKKLAIKDKQASANTIAAKNAGKSDPTLAAALLNSPNVEAEKPKSNTGLYVGIGIGVVVLGVGAWLLIKKPWKKK
jgi:hypothetical protein